MIYDSAGDGICCEYGDGYYLVKQDGQVIDAGGPFGENAATILGASSCNCDVSGMLSGKTIYIAGNGHCNEIQLYPGGFISYQKGERNCNSSRFPNWRRPRLS